MVLALFMLTQVSNVVLIMLCGIVLLFLLKTMKPTDKLWLASVASILCIVLLAMSQIASYNNLSQQLQDKEAALQVLTAEYARVKAATESARASYSDARKDVSISRQEFDDLRNKVTAEFERTIREIRSVYAEISDEELNRRFNNAVRKARQHLRENVFQ